MLIWHFLCVQVLTGTLSPAWCETLLFDRVLLEGVTEELKQDPPLVIINFYSYQNTVTVTLSFKSVYFPTLFSSVSMVGLIVSLHVVVSVEQYGAFGQSFC